MSKPFVSYCTKCSKGIRAAGTSICSACSRGGKGVGNIRYGRFKKSEETGIDWDNLQEPEDDDEEMLYGRTK